MDAPLYKFGLFGDDFSLVVAFVIGIGFGFFLERGGFGSGRKLAAQFYFRDMAVLKVMFSAIVTAMVGVYWLSRVGVLDLSQVYLVPTRIWPNVVGGLILGVGFVIGGYCPGTSVVAAATGRVDAMIYLLGMYAGMIGVGFVWPSMTGFIDGSLLGPLTLAKAWNIPYGVLVAGVVLMAAGAFLAAEWAEVKSGGRTKAEGLLLAEKRSRPSWIFVGGFVALGLVAAVSGTPYRGPRLSLDGTALAQSIARDADHVTVEDLAARLIEGRNDLQLVDLRSPGDFAAYRLPGARNIPITELATNDWRADEAVLLYSDDGERAAQAWMYLKSKRIPRVYTLEGGLAGWKDHILFPVLPDPIDDATRQEVDRRRSVALHFGGQPRGAAATPTAMPIPEPVMPTIAAPPPGEASPAPAAKKKKKEGC